MQIKYLNKEKIKIYYSPAGHYPYLDQNLKKKSSYETRHRNIYLNTRQASVTFLPGEFVIFSMTIRKQYPLGTFFFYKNKST